MVLFEGTLSDINISEEVHLELYIGGILIDDKEINGDIIYQCISDSPQANFEKISIGNSYYNMDTNNQFLSIDELKGKTIEVNDTGSVAIKDVEATDSYTKITVNISDYYDMRFLGFMEIIDEDFNVCNNEGFNMGPVIENSSEKEISVTLPPLDKSKKYTISLPRILDLNIDDANKIRVNLN